MIVYIYGLYCPKTNSLRYIGKALNTKTRYDLHISETRCGRNSHKNQWLSGLLAEGLYPEMRILEVIENSNDHDWQERERWWIQAARESGDPLTNLDDGGRCGQKKSEETREKMRQKAIGRKQTPEAIEKMKATKRASMTPELRQRLAEINIGRKQSEETIRKRSESMKGRVVSEETRRKISESNKKTKGPPKPKPERIPQPRKPISAESREKMRQAKLGRKLTPEALAKRIAKQTGQKRSPEIRAKMSEAKKLGWARRKALALEQAVTQKAALI